MEQALGLLKFIRTVPKPCLHICQESKSFAHRTRMMQKGCLSLQLKIQTLFYFSNQCACTAVCAKMSLLKNIRCHSEQESAFSREMMYQFLHGERWFRLQKKRPKKWRQKVLRVM